MCRPRVALAASIETSSAARRNWCTGLVEPLSDEFVELYQLIYVPGGGIAVKPRILDYNEDYYVATRVVLDGIRGL